MKSILDGQQHGLHSQSSSSSSSRFSTDNKSSFSLLGIKNPGVSFNWFMSSSFFNSVLFSNVGPHFFSGSLHSKVLLFPFRFLLYANTFSALSRSVLLKFSKLSCFPISPLNSPTRPVTPLAALDTRYLAPKLAILNSFLRVQTDTIKKIYIEISPYIYIY